MDLCHLTVISELVGRITETNCVTLTSGNKRKLHSNPEHLGTEIETKLASGLFHDALSIYARI
jgi:hypothetical protein